MEPQNQNSSLPEPSMMSEESMKRVMDKIQEDNNNVSSPMFGTVDGRKTNIETY